jgi:O-antigen ligase
MRISSFFSEPGYLAAGLSPAAFLAVNCVTLGNRTYFSRAQALLILCAMFLTFSSIGYCAIALSLAFHFQWRQWKRALVPVLAIGAAGLWVGTSVDFFRSRIEGLWISVVTREVTGSENFSSLNYAMNGEITRQNLIERPLIGSGFDSYFATALGALDRMSLPDGFLKLVEAQDIEIFNFVDGSTMYFKVLTEFGLVGTALILLFFYTNRVRGTDPEPRLLQRMCIVFLLTYSLRTGQYIRFELWYFIALYCCIKQGDADVEPSSRPPGLTEHRKSLSAG